MEYLEILVAGVAAWALGALWYSPVLFSRPWQSAVGLSDDDMQGANMPLIFGLSFVCMFVIMFALRFILLAHGPEITIAHGAFHGALAGLFYNSMAMAINYLYQRKPIKLWFIDAGYQILFMAIGGAIMVAM